MLQSPWIKSANVRKEFPGTVAITIQEAEPFALLDMNEHFFLIDDKGKLLEELKGDAEPFLPVIVSDPYKEKEGFSEALHLVRLLNEKGLTAGRDHMEIIAHKPHELSIEMDEAVVKIGAGEYDEKIERLIHLEADLRERNIPVDYIDLRFGDKAIVKPITVKKVEE
jgi:cell division protein FtsQ